MQDLVLEFQVMFGFMALLFFYLIGSVNTARVFVFLTRQKGILEAGTGNAGANNIWRVYGKKFGRKIGVLAGSTVMFFDIGKGVLIIYLARDIFGFPEWLALTCGIAGMAGHCWPVQWRFRRGGKAIAILGGILLMLHPLSMLVILPIALFLPAFKRLSGLVPFVAIPVYIIAGGAESPETIGILFGALALIYLRRVDAEWPKLQEQPSKLKAFWYLLIYDRATNDPPPL